PEITRLPRRRPARCYAKAHPMPRSIARAGAAAGVILLLALFECSRTPLGGTPAGQAAGDARAADAVAPPPHRPAFPPFHCDRARTGWTDAESTLVPSAVARGMGRAWASAPLDDAAVAYSDSTGMHVGTFPPRIFAAPLYLDDVTLAAPPYAGTRASVVVV